MFEKLTQVEANRLDYALSQAYSKSHAAAAHINANKLSASQASYGWLCDKMLNQQAGMRQEISMIRAQLDREVAH